MHHELINESQVNIHASRVHIHALQLIFMHREKISYLAEIYALQEDFIPCGIYELREDIHARKRSCIESQYSCITGDNASRVNIHVSQKTMHRESIFMHRKLICMHNEKISYLA